MGLAPVKEQDNFFESFLMALSKVGDYSPTVGISHCMIYTLPDCQISLSLATQFFQLSFGRRKKITRRYLLSRFHNYHRLQALSIRIRDGNARFHLDMVAGSSTEVLFKPQKNILNARVSYPTRNNRSMRSNVRPLVPIS